MYEITHNELKGDVKLITDVEKSSTFKCGTFGAASTTTRFLATGDFKGKLAIWDLESTSLPVYSADAHKVQYSHTLKFVPRQTQWMLCVDLQPQ